MRDKRWGGFRLGGDRQRLPFLLTKASYVGNIVERSSLPRAQPMSRSIFVPDLFTSPYRAKMSIRVEPYQKKDVKNSGQSRNVYENKGKGLSIGAKNGPI